MIPMKPHRKVPELDTLEYPLLASPKLDGIRCVNVDGVPLSYEQKPIPNRFITDMLLRLLKYYDLDGELMIDGDFNQVQSVVMSFNHLEEEKFYLNVFDNFAWPNKPFYHRLESARRIVNIIDSRHVRFVEHILIHNPKDLQKYWELQVDKGYEGVVTRAVNGIYKFGRSTIKEGYARKLKHFDDDEGLIIGYEELMHNLDTSTNKLENQLPGDTLGALILSWQGKTVKVGSGFSAEERARLWAIRNDLCGQRATFKFQGVSRYDIPRFPVYKAIRRD